MTIFLARYNRLPPPRFNLVAHFPNPCSKPCYPSSLIPIALYYIFSDSNDSFYEQLDFLSFLKYNVKILLDFKENLRRDGIFKQAIRNESLHQDSDDNGVRIVNFATSKNMIVKMLPHRNLHKYAWTSPDGKIDNQTDHVLIDTRWYLSILDVRSVRGADCDTDHCLAVAQVRESLEVSKQAVQNFDAERFNFRNQNGMEFREQYQTEISNRFASLENLNDSEDINSAWESINENITTSSKEVYQN